MTESLQVCPAGRERYWHMSSVAAENRWHHKDDDSPCHADARCIKYFKCGLERRTWGSTHASGAFVVLHLQSTYKDEHDRLHYSTCHGLACPDKLLAEDMEERRKDERRVIEAHVRLHHTYPGSLGMNMQFWHPKAEHWLNEQRRTEVDHRHRDDGPPKAQQRVPGKGERRQLEARKEADLVRRPHASGVWKFQVDRRIATEPRRQAEMQQDGGHPEEHQVIHGEGFPTNYSKQTHMFISMGLQNGRINQGETLWLNGRLWEAADTIEALTERAEAAEEGKRVAEELVREILRSDCVYSDDGCRLCYRGYEHWQQEKDIKHSEFCPQTTAREAGILEEEK